MVEMGQAMALLGEVFSAPRCLAGEENLELIPSAGHLEDGSALMHSSWLGRMLAKDVLAVHDVPSAPTSRLDGYAVISSSASAGSVFPVVREVRAGDKMAREPLKPGTACWITTGAPLPHGADAVIPVESTAAAELEGKEAMKVLKAAPAGNGVRSTGSDQKEGEAILAAGHVLQLSDWATLLSAGITKVAVRRRPRVAVFSTGNELIDPASVLPASGSGHACLEGGTVDSNRGMLRLLLEAAGAEVLDLGIWKDDYDSILTQLRSHANSPSTDLLVCSGGVSMGDRDFVKPACEALGRVLFGRLNMKPGKPTTFALLSRSSRMGGEKEGGAPAAATPAEAASAASAGASSSTVPIFALPGNPVSAWVCAQMLVLPAVKALQGYAWPSACLPVSRPLTLLDSVAMDPERPEFHRVTAWWASSTSSSSSGAAAAAAALPWPGIQPDAPPAELFGRSTGSQASSRIASTVQANALAWVPAGSGILPAGSKLAAWLLDMPPPAAARPAALTDQRRLGQEAHRHSHAGGCGCGLDHSAVEAAAAAQAGGAAAGGAAELHPSFLHGPAPTAAAAAASSSSSGSSATAVAAGSLKSPPLSVRVAILTVSDRCFAGEAQDKAGPAALQWLQSEAMQSRLHVSSSLRACVPDEPDQIRAAVSSWAALGEGERPHLIITSGGTGLSPRDITPEALRPLIARPAHGLVQAMLSFGMQKTPLAALSRYEAGVTKEGCLLVEMPGSVKAVQECLQALQLLLPHALALLRG